MRANLPQETPHLPREMCSRLQIAGYVTLLKEMFNTFAIEFFYLYVLVQFDIVQHIDPFVLNMLVNQHIYDEDHYEI
jgi:hypothetical protein